MVDDSVPISAVRLAFSGSEVTLGRGEHVIGRSAECAIRIDDPLTSRRHAVIAVSATDVTVRDLGSRNGVLVNGEDIDGVRTLGCGDLITVGSQPFKVVEICRTSGPISTPGQHAGPRSAPLARIAVIRKAVSGDDDTSGTIPARTTQGREDGPFHRPHAIYALMAEAATRAIAEGRVQRAEKILEVALGDVLEDLRARRDVDDEIVDLAIQQALSLAEATRKRRWVEYVREVYAVLRMAVPAAVAARIAGINPTPA
jgi:hypothetical protein